jgi:large subunit ribosomal protein L21
MYAVIEQGGKQFKVSEGDVINIELTEVAPDAKTIELNKVLFVSDGQSIKVGAPYLDGAKVIASFKVSAADAVVKTAAKKSAIGRNTCKSPSTASKPKLRRNT